MARDAVQSAVDHLADELQRSVVIDDPGVHLLYSSPHYGDEDQVRVRSILQRDAGSKVIGHVLAQGVAAWTRPGVIPPDDALGMRARVCVPVRWRGELVGLLMVMDAEGTLTTAELGRIDAAARDLAPLLAQLRDDTEVPARERALLDLVDGEPGVRRRALVDLAATPGAERFTTVTAVEVAITASSEGMSAHGEAALRGALAVAPRQATVARWSAVGGGGVGVLLLGSPAPLPVGAVRDHAVAVLEQLRDLSAGRFSSTAGTGSSVAGLERAADSAAQARLARRAASGALATSVAAWAELGPFGLLLRIPEQELDESVLPDELQRLRAVDRDGHLAATVRAYLDHGCNGPEAAAALHVHRTTLYYRLGRVTELTGLDLTDGRTRLALHLGLAAADVLRTRSSPAGPP